MSFFNSLAGRISNLINPSVVLPIQHPYYPQNALLSTYVANTTAPTTLVATISTAVAIVAASSWFGLGYVKTQKALSSEEKGIATWYIVSGTIALLFEGFYVWKGQEPGALAADQSILGELWKEYALSDSRYLTGDKTLYYLELLSVVFWGPLSFLAAYDTVTGASRAKIAQTTAAVGHLLSASVYYSTSLWDLSQGVSHSRPEPQYFWLYFVGFNLPWIIVPSYLVYRNYLAQYFIAPAPAAESKPVASTKGKKR